MTKTKQTQTPEKQWLKKSKKSHAAGWNFLHIEGAPYERGYQHGYHMAKELENVLKVNNFWAEWSTGMAPQFFIDAAVKMFLPYVDDECIEEIGGIAAGSTAAGVPRTLCGHIDNDDAKFGGSNPQPAYYPWGAVDGMAVDSKMALEMSIWARFGRSCGEAFNAGEFLEKHPQYDWLEGYLWNRPQQPWTQFFIE